MVQVLARGVLTMTILASAAGIYAQAAGAESALATGDYPCTVDKRLR
ncbi:hypothetical protein RFUL19S_01506 [Rhizobacter fulvus]